ncbi:exodeoxyribonuclease VII large subunit [Candidatus Saccharibacteria bacterium]|nr:exodeoxyribonuclease VII large subunit [Candidatus Saccharibacteria bacterium]MBQ9016768.1 exodeoxyribonuclease VII large subunit [Candidatus Saccharibacteria bacterium]
MYQDPRLSVSEFIDVCNQTLDYAYPSVLIEGEVSGFKINQGKWVFFDLKDEEASLPCFLPLFKLKTPLEDGMKILVRGYPKLMKWGRFSFTVEQIMPVGEGSIKKAFEMLKKQLEKEGLFDPERKRPLPENLTKIGVISSTGAAGYADFCKIINARWGGLKIQTAHVQVQGIDAPAQIIRALNYFNEKAEVQLVVIIRGGGSSDDLACFNDESLARAIAVSKIPVMTGIGHEVDESLADLAADLRGSTPSNVAELITPDKRAVQNQIETELKSAGAKILQAVASTLDSLENYRKTARTKIDAEIEKARSSLRLIERLNPELVLKQGYSIVSGKLAPGEIIEITTTKQIAQAEIKQVKERN